MHEDKRVRLLVQVLNRDILNIRCLKFVAPFVGAVQNCVAKQVSELAFVKCITFARFHKVHFDHQIWIAINLNFETFFEVVGLVGCHCYPLSITITQTLESGPKLSVPKLVGRPRIVYVTHWNSAVSEILTKSIDPVEASFRADVGHSRWQTALKTAIRWNHQLERFLHLESSPELSTDFPVLVPLEFAARMRKGDRNDPLLKQVLATAEENLPGGLLDPVGDMGFCRTGGLLQKYKGRILLVTTGACAVHCRYCFRRNLPYNSLTIPQTAWDEWIDTISRDESIHEVILSGGDPLSIVDETWSDFIERLNKVSHVQRLRIHSRFPVVIPQRVNSELTCWLRKFHGAVYFVLHMNHAHEIDGPVKDMLGRLRASGVTLLNQAVLLKDVNDSIDAQLELCRVLIDNQILPYYLHQLDPVRGGMHFEVAEDVGHTIVSALRAELPGYAVPQFVREVPGAESKLPV